MLQFQFIKLNIIFMSYSARQLGKHNFKENMFKVIRFGKFNLFLSCIAV